MSASQSAARRTVLKGAAVLAGAAGTAATLAACSPGASNSGSGSPAVPAEPVELGAASEVPVGGSKLFRERKVVVHCPAEGQYKAFSAQCTHAGCVLDKVVESEGNCPCHGSRFDVTTGKVLRGPATDPLPAVPVKAEGGKLIAG